MSKQELVCCDYCEAKVNMLNYGAPTFIHLFLGGSDFEMSFNQDTRNLDFCSLKCLSNWLKEQEK